MKQTMSIVLIIVMMFTITVPVNAETCNLDASLKALENIEIKAVQTKGSFAFTISIKNINDKYFVLDAYGNRYDSKNNEIFIDPGTKGQFMFAEGIEYRLSIFGSEKSSCENTLIYEEVFQTLIENTIKDDNLCKDDEKFYLCAEYIHIEDIDKNFAEEWGKKENSNSNYNKETNKSIILTSNYETLIEKTKNSTLLIRMSIAGIFLIILIILFLVYKKNRGGK